MKSTISDHFTNKDEQRLYASAFWTLEDGRGFARNWGRMAYMLKLITDELKTIKGAGEFYDYLERFVFKEETGNSENGYGGFIRGNENIMFNFDLRTFAPQNREFFWQAAQRALTNLKIRQDSADDGTILLLTVLLDMHKRIMRGEDPVELNDMRTVEPEPNEKL